MIDKLLDFVHIIPCREATRLMSHAMDRKLTWGESIQLKLHLSVCDACERFGRQILSLRKLLRGYKPQNEKHMSAEVKERIKKNLSSQ